MIYKRREMDIHERIRIAMANTCPDCGSPLRTVPARRFHQGHDPEEVARECTNDECEFWCFNGMFPENKRLNEAKMAKVLRGECWKCGGSMQPVHTPPNERINFPGPGTLYRCGKCKEWFFISVSALQDAG